MCYILFVNKCKHNSEIQKEIIVKKQIRFIKHVLYRKQTDTFLAKNNFFKPPDNEQITVVFDAFQNVIKSLHFMSLFLIKKSKNLTLFLSDKLKSEHFLSVLIIFPLYEFYFFGIFKCCKQ